jgi:phospholipid/cholesterol/gamma-HCH transport system ATP-binding protein
MIEVKDVHKYFGDNHVLKGISAVLEDGKCNLIIGRSGSGKTVLMKCLVGLFTPEEGEILYDGRQFSKASSAEKKKIRQDIGMVFQGGALFDSLNCEENVAFPLRMFTNMSKSELKQRVNYCMERVNLVNANKLFPSEISGGMKKRVAIARAIALKPKYLFFDEPNSGLDPQTSIVIDELITEITKEINATTIINTHDMNSVFEMGEKILYIYKGEKNWEGNASQIASSGNKELLDFIFASNLLKRVQSTF